MLKEERFARTIEYLKANNTASVNSIAKLNSVSVDTARRDLEVLEEYGVLDRVRGGAVWRRESLAQHVYEMRMTVNSEAKSELAPLIKKILEDGQTLVINSGSTTVEMARFIALNYKRLTVITNDLDIVSILSNKEHFRIILLGGFVDKEENATYGNQCENEVKQYNADVGVFAVNSISVDRGIRDFRLNQMEAIIKMMKISDKVAIATDASKFEKNACMSLCNLDEVDYILSDKGLSKDKIDQFEAKGIKVIVPED